MSINKIICATKGSKESMIAEDKAIEIAKENNAILIFLYVINIELLEKGGDVSEGALEDIESGMKNIGNVILQAAEEKAVEKGIAPDKIIKEELEGDFMTLIKERVSAHNADLFVIGHSLAGKGFLERLLMSKEKTETFEKRIKEQLKCEVRIV